MYSDNDHIITATAAEGRIRAFFALTKETAETARKAHNLSPVATAALGRLLTAGAMMGITLKNEDDLVTLQINGDGPMRGLTVTADNDGNVKGYVKVPDVLLPPNAVGKLDVGGAIGRGMLSVIRDMGLKDPYIGQVELQTSEIAEDLTYYFSVSEQTPSAVSLGVLMEKNNTVKQSGGFMIQLMPGIEDDVVDKLERKLEELPSVTTMLDNGDTPEAMVKGILGDFNPEILDRRPVRFFCKCSKQRVEKALISTGRAELQSMIDDGKPIEVKCQFCNKAYSFDTGELEHLLAAATEG
ncbi:MAG TPA: Hsp33 family molecular chaperone HslO [Lachnospiraceae bacterium]|nr:Hsp33 family molecular chaperone HslO [Lachnospiraceae bacterium]